MGLSNLLSKRSLLGTVEVPKGGEVTLAVIDLSYEGEGLTISYTFQACTTHLESFPIAYP